MDSLNNSLFRNNTTRYTRYKKRGAKRSTTTNKITYKTPRTEYYSKFLSVPPILLEKNPMFQIYYSSVFQFINYVNIHPSPYDSRHYPDCFINTIFALGLRHVKTVHTDIAHLYNINPTEGIMIQYICRYLETSFGLPINSVTINSYIHSEKNMVYDNIFKEYSDGIKTHYATLVFIYTYNKITMKRLGHIIIVFKHDTSIWFFDPQINVITGNISTLYGPSIVLMGYSKFMVHNVNTPKQLVKTAYALPIYG